MKKTTLMTIIMVFLLFTSSVVATITDREEMEAASIINSKVSCDELSDEQLVSLGEYYMEQMHPENAHELMDEMMGGEGSSELIQMHINMARKFYCKENINMMGNGMMSGCRMMKRSIGMMGGKNMMGNYGNMMGNGYYSGSWWPFGIISSLFSILVLIILVLLAIWLYKKVVNDNCCCIPEHKNNKKK